MFLPWCKSCSHRIFIKTHVINRLFLVSADETLPRGVIGTNLMHRRWAQFSLKQDVYVRPYDPFQAGYDIYLSAMQIEVGFFKKSSQVDTEMNADDMAQVFSNVSTYYRCLR
jgi:vesicle-fusing ATPase